MKKIKGFHGGKLPRVKEFGEDFNYFYSLIYKGDKTVAKSIINDWEIRIKSIQKRLMEMKEQLPIHLE